MSTRTFKTYRGAEAYGIKLARRYPSKLFSLRVVHADTIRDARYYVVTFIEQAGGVLEVGMS